MKPQTLTCPKDPRYTIELDYREAHPADPGVGTPAMVHGPHGTHGTFACVTDTGWLNEGDRNGHELPPSVLSWLEDRREHVERYVNAAFKFATNPRAGKGDTFDKPVEILDITVESEGDYVDEVEIISSSVDDDQMEFLLQSGDGVIYARDQNGVVIEMWLDMDEQSLVARPVKETASGMEPMSDDEWREHLPPALSP